MRYTKSTYRLLYFTIVNGTEHRAVLLRQPIIMWLKASSPACTELETIVMDWLAKAIGLPPIFYH